MSDVDHTMVWATADKPSRSVWELAREQHGVVSRAQLAALGFGRRAVEHRLRTGRLHRIGARRATWRGVYAVGRPQLSDRGRWMAAVLCCGAGAALSHHSAAALWGIRRPVRGPVHVSATKGRARSRPGIRLHERRTLPGDDLTRREGIPVTSPARTLIDLAATLDVRAVEAAVNEADVLDLIHPGALLAAVEARPGARGAPKLREVLDRQSFVLTSSHLERLFLPLARGAGLPRPRAGVWVSGFEVDFHWPELGLVVEADGGRFHRTGAQQTRDRERDQAHARAGLTPLRFTHFQIAHEPEAVVATLEAVAARLRRGPPAPGPGRR